MKKINESRIALVISLFAIIISSLVGITQLHDWFKNRKPRLELFVPEYYTGFDPGLGKRALAMLTCISNQSRKNVYLLPETLSVEVQTGDRWYKTHVGWIVDKDYIDTDFTEHQKTTFGVKQVKLLKRFERPVITYDKPLTRYIVVTHDDTTILEHIDGIRMRFIDCHKQLYEMEVNLTEQKKYDPEYQPDKL